MPMFSDISGSLLVRVGEPQSVAYDHCALGAGAGLSLLCSAGYLLIVASDSRRTLSKSLFIFSAKAWTFFWSGVETGRSSGCSKAASDMGTRPNRASNGVIPVDLLTRQFTALCIIGRKWCQLAYSSVWRSSINFSFLTAASASPLAAGLYRGSGCNGAATPTGEPGSCGT